MSKLVVVNGFSYQFSVPTVSATVTLTGSPSSKSKCSGNGICVDQFGATITNITNPPATIPDPGPYNVKFSATSTKVKADGSFVLRVDDVTEDITATPKTPSTPSPIDTPVTFHLKITNANQIKVRAE